MKTFFSFILILFFVLSGTGQQEIYISSKENKEPLGNAVIKILDVKSGAVETFFPDNSGRLVLAQSKPGSYIEVSVVGYETLKDTLSNQSVIRLGLQPDNLFDEVVVTAQYNAVSANKAVQKITVISQDQIIRSGSNNLSDILNYQAGIRLTQDNVLGSSMNLEGISGENVKILIDGVPVIGRLNGNVDVSQINLNNVERIEIVEGPLSVNYGTNALAGTINIITKKAPKKSIDVNVNPYYESIGNYNFTVAAGVKMKSNSLQVNAGRNYFDGWSADDPFFQFPKSRLADTNRFKTWKPKEQYFGDIRYNTSVSGWNISPYLRYFDELIINRGYPIQPYYETAFDDYYHTNRTDVGTTIKKKFKKSNLNTIIAYNNFIRVKNTYFKDLTNLEQTLSETPGAQDTSRFTLTNVRVNYQFYPLSKLDVELGADVNYESAYGVRILNLEQFIGDYAAFVTGQWRPAKKLIIKPGLRYAYNSVYDAPVIPSVNLKWQSGAWALRGSIARGFRAPSLKELYFDFVDINHNIHGITRHF